MCWDSQKVHFLKLKHEIKCARKTTYGNPYDHEAPMRNETCFWRIRGAMHYPRLSLYAMHFGKKCCIEEFVLTYKHFQKSFSGIQIILLFALCVLSASVIATVSIIYNNRFTDKVNIDRSFETSKCRLSKDRSNKSYGWFWMKKQKGEKMLNVYRAKREGKFCLKMSKNGGHVLFNRLWLGCCQA